MARPVRDVDLNVQVGDVLDARVVGVLDQGLKGHDGVHGRDEASVTQPHGVHPLDNAVLHQGHSAALDQE